MTTRACPLRATARARHGVRGAPQRLVRRFLAVVLTLTLAGCKVELHRSLSETEANQMLALLLVSGLQADKRADANGVTVRIERGDFVRGVEVLRQHGLPREKRASVADVFPAGQLVSSPVQEQAKLAFLKEQRLERMLASLDGVMAAEVSIAQVPTDSAGRATLPPGVAVFLKYSPEINMTQRMTDIRSLVHDSVPGVTPERISIVLQPADYRLPRAALDAQQARQGRRFVMDGWSWVALTGAAAALLGGGAVILHRRGAWLTRVLRRGRRTDDTP
ncbi:type III secretion inner membrane ring lipoprotein SctJ [Pandoraea nosoerga]|uniref:Lipoprotein n=1 Tax=Pandoraea nosoerga TaxID=2508296 RepID=A0A5E4XGB0_9BURK|nr:type III secretion inner membrane ring lipoprotein SctJ [Pandoraea nosoerga]MBN4668264.1 type III secretion inner membrane ring lipoprotein SctJ [Pandoraea nosoerga]MBN4677755.1 type III secretion inner membrane ring lipoprotein SctJ [Pandoraea nosoerga]MBN4682717.1 type III secretion inner membrane ring lipoprotein SctJ [Pandoraea nosoerga]MBN4746587.1 type III secretion inner membrane ring lipoprotein SctJ [Pandoraea nosoerga]VVE35343.1 EscJ/YscJ/HrcJ family type III secretion inner membr